MVALRTKGYSQLPAFACSGDSSLSCSLRITKSVITFLFAAPFNIWSNWLAVASSFAYYLRLSVQFSVQR